MFSGNVYNNGIKIQDTSELAWNAHPLYRGVFIGNLLSSENTGHKISTHIVKIEPDCEISLHVHAGKAELHEIIDGEGIAYICNNKVDYRAGVSSFIPEDTPHSISAGVKGLILFAKFTPAL